MSHEEEKRSMLERKRNILLLVAQYLSDNGLHLTTELLAKESALLAGCQLEHQLCDNVDLDAIYLDYMSYHQLKFGRPPRIAKRVEADASGGDGASAAKNKSISGSAPNLSRRKPSQRSNNSQLRSELDSAKEKLLANKESESDASTGQLANAITVSQLFGGSSTAEQPSNSDQKPPPTTAGTQFTRPLLRHHPNYSSADWAAMADVICRDIVDATTLTGAVHWDSLCGLAAAKEALTDGVLLPLEHPHLFAGPLLVRPWKCILLHGPPGTGKTSLARALCERTAGRATFFNVAASSMVSKWRGDSEKLVRVLFDLAKYFAPSIVFVDEVESLMSRRDGAGADQHEASRRFKNELLTHLDGLHELSDQQHVCVLGSTNLPWDLDAAFLRRFERKVLLGLPDAAARQQIYARLRAKTVPAHTSDEIGDATREFSGDDIRIAYKAAAMRKIRECVPGEDNPNPVSLLRPEMVRDSDFVDACRLHRPSAHALMPKYEQWQHKHGGM